MYDPFYSPIFGGYGFNHGTSAGSMQIAETVPTRETKPKLGEEDASKGNATTLGSFGGYINGGLGGYAFLTGLGSRPISTPWVYLDCLLHPVLAAARAYSLNPIRCGKWKIRKTEDAKPEWAEFVKKATELLIHPYLEDAVWSVDMGWAGFQVVFAREDGKYVIPKLIACKQEAGSGILVDPHSHEPIGLKWNGIDLYGHKQFFVTNERRGQEYLGRSRIENCIQAISNWNEENHTTARLGRKASGIVVGIGHPTGYGLDKNGNRVTMASQAAEFGKLITSGTGSFDYPTLGGLTEEQIAALLRDPDRLIKLLGASFWQFNPIDLGDPGASLAAVTQDKRYLDELICLGYYCPPEAILKGDSGNRAKSESQGGNGTAMNEIVNRGCANAFNRGPVDSLMLLNFGKESVGKVWWEPEPLEDSQVLFDRQILQAAMNGQGPWAQEMYRFYDLAAIAERNGIPKRAMPLPEPKPEPQPGAIGKPVNGNGRMKELAGKEEN